ncbi:hypothetical protein NFI96_008875, partial [Prochilodus magdalenae]
MNIGPSDADGGKISIFGQSHPYKDFCCTVFVLTCNQYLLCTELECPTIWIMGSSYIRRSEERARKTTGTNLGLNAKVYWFGQGGMRWHAFIPFFKQSLQERPIPDVLVIHCGGNDLGRLRSVDLVSAMKKDLHDVHQKFPHTKIVFSAITQRPEWRYANPRKMNKSRKFVNSVMAAFVEVAMVSQVVANFTATLNFPATGCVQCVSVCGCVVCVGVCVVYSVVVCVECCEVCTCVSGVCTVCIVVCGCMCCVVLCEVVCIVCR